MNSYCTKYNPINTKKDFTKNPIQPIKQNYFLLLITAQDHILPCERDDTSKFFLQPKNHLFLHHTFLLPELHTPSNMAYRYRKVFSLMVIYISDRCLSRIKKFFSHNHFISKFHVISTNESLRRQHH